MDGGCIMEWKHYKDIRKIYQFDGEWIHFTYYNKCYSRNTVELILLLREEIYKDFPQVTEDEIFVKESLDFPKEILLQFRVRKEMVILSKLLEFDMLPQGVVKL